MGSRCAVQIYLPLAEQLQAVPWSPHREEGHIYHESSAWGAWYSLSAHRHRGSRPYVVPNGFHRSRGFPTLEPTIGPWGGVVTSSASFQGSRYIGGGQQTSTVLQSGLISLCHPHVLKKILD